MRLRDLRKLVEQLSAGGSGVPSSIDWANAYQLDANDPDSFGPGQAVQDWGLNGVWQLPNKRCLVTAQLTNNAPNGFAVVSMQVDESSAMPLASIGSGLQGGVELSIEVPPNTLLRCEGSYVTGDSGGGAVTSVLVAAYL